MLYSGLGIRSLVFRVNHSFFESKRAKGWFAVLKVQIALVDLFYMSNGSKRRLLQRARAMKSGSLCCFGHKRRKANRSYKEPITHKKSESLFHKEKIAPVTLYLKTKFSPVNLYKKSNGRELERAKSERVNSQPWLQCAETDSALCFIMLRLIAYVLCNIVLRLIAY